MTSGSHASPFVATRMARTATFDSPMSPRNLASAPNQGQSAVFQALLMETNPHSTHPLVNARPRVVTERKAAGSRRVLSYARVPPTQRSVTTRRRPRKTTEAHQAGRPQCSSWPCYFLRAVAFLRVVRRRVAFFAGFAAALVRLRARRLRAFFAGAFLAAALRPVFRPLRAVLRPVDFFAAERLRAVLRPVDFFAAFRALFFAGNLVTSFPRDSVQASYEANRFRRRLSRSERPPQMPNFSSFASA